MADGKKRSRRASQPAKPRSRAKVQTRTNRKEDHRMAYAVLNALSEYVLYLDTDMRIQWANQVALESSRLTWKKLIGSRCHRVWHRRDETCPGCPVFKALQTGCPQEGEIKSPEGRHWFIRAYPIRNQPGDIAGFAEIALDVTERNRAEESLRESEELYRTLIETCPDGVTLTDIEGRLIMANREGAWLYGCETAEELLSQGKTAFDFIVPEERMRALENARKTIAEGSVRNIEYTVTRKDGCTYPAEISAALILDHNRRPKGFLGMVRDITERKRAEQALRESEAKYATLVEQAQDAVVIIQDGVCKLANRAVRMSGYTAEEVRNRTFIELVAPECREEIASKHQAHFLRGEARYETKILCKDGSRLDIEVSATPIQYEGRPAIFGIARNISERKRAEAERRKLEEQVQYAQKLESLGLVTGGIAHDFNNLLMGVLGNASLALLELPQKSPEHYYVKQIERSAQRAAELTNQLLTYSGRGTCKVQVVSLSRLVEEMIDLLKVSIPKKVSFKFDFKRDLPPIEADATQIRQVAMNLITNASEAIGAESGVVTVRTGSMEASRDYLSRTYMDDNLSEGPYTFLEVSDTGCGMDQETKEKLFDPFFTTKFAGRGLGMAAVLGIVRRHRGAIEVDSRPRQGARVRVLFPTTKRRETVPMEEPKPAKVERCSGKILVVDDEEIVLEVARHMLESAGFSVLTAKDGREGIEIFRAQPDRITAVLLDATMPCMDGEEAVCELRRIHPQVKVILTSGYSQQETTERFAERGLAGFIQKPYQINQLIDKLREVMGNSG